MIDLSTAKAVLAKASLFDQTLATPDLAIAVAWAEALGNIDQDDALDAVTSHYTTQTRRIMPADVIAGVKRIRGERLRLLPSSELEPADADPSDVVGYLDAVRDRRRALASGAAVHPSDPSWAPRRDVQKLLTDTAAKLPQVPSVEVGDAS